MGSWSKFGLGLMSIGLCIYIGFVMIQVLLAGLGFAFYAAGFIIFRWQAVIRHRENGIRIWTELQHGSPDAARVRLEEQSRIRQHRHLKLLGLFAVLLFPFYDKLIEMLMEALVFGHGDIPKILGLMALTFSVAFIAGTGGMVIEDLLEKRAGREMD